MMDGVLTLPRRTKTHATAHMALKLLLLAAGDGAQMQGKTLGLIGFDATAADLARRAHHGFGMEVVIYSATPIAPTRLAAFQGRQVSDLAALLPVSDVVSLHVKRATRPVLTGPMLDLMPEDALLIDAAHTGAVDQMALAQSLMFDLIGGAALHLNDDTTPLHPLLAHCDTLVLTRGDQTTPDDFYPTFSPRDRVA